MYTYHVMKIIKIILTTAVIIFNGCSLLQEKHNLLPGEEEKIKKLEIYRQQHDEMMKIVKEGKIEDCNSLKMDVYQKYCQINSYIFQAQLSSDATLCENIDSKELLLACKRSIRSAQ